MFITVILFWSELSFDKTVLIKQLEADEDLRYLCRKRV